MYESLMAEASSCHRILRRRNAAGFNRRMRKTARPVVWEGAGAQSPAPDPIGRFPPADLTLDLVYSAALREVRSSQRAEEIAQSFFGDLAQNVHRAVLRPK